MPVIGDSNHDGIFNSSDLTRVFQAGEYEDDIPGNSTFEDGDWNGDGELDSGDLVYAFQAGTYVSAAVPGSLFVSAAAQRETLVVNRRGFATDRQAEKVDTDLIDQLFAQMVV